MKITRMRNLFFSTLPLATISLCIGYAFWYIASYNHFITLETTIPLYFSDSSGIYQIDAPEKISITLLAKRSDLYDIDQKNFAAHINIDKLLPGNHGIIVTEQDLFLPSRITLIKYKPNNLSVTIKEKN